MENNKLTSENIQQSIANTTIEAKKVSLNCNIRLRKGLVSVPNQSPEEFVHYLESIMAPSGGPLKGVTGTLERVLMPSIIDVSTNDNSFQSHIKDYWANFSNILPCDSENKRDTEQGIIIKIAVTLLSNKAQKDFEKVNRIDEKFEVVHKLLEEQEEKVNSIKHISLNPEYYADFLKLAFALKHSRIANRVEDKEKSPKIFGYIYEKAVDVKEQESEMEVFNSFSTNLTELKDEQQINAILLAIDETVSDFDTITDKKIIIYNTAKTSHAVRLKVNKLISDKNWMHKYYVQQGINLHILKQPVNSKLVQYGDSIIGNDIESAAFHLKSTPEGEALLAVIKNKLNIN